MKSDFRRIVLPLFAAFLACVVITTCSKTSTAKDDVPRAALYSPARVLASVRIGKNGGCSGTIFLTHGKYAWGLSAAHCASFVGQEFTFGNPDGSEGPARWIAIDRTHDLALFHCWSEDVLAVAPVPYNQVPDWTTATEAIGYPGTRGPKWKQVRPRGQARINRGMQRMHFQPTYGPFAGGDSGGGVFYDGDYLVGVMTHGINNREIYAATLQQITAFLETHRGKFRGADPFQCQGGRCRPSPGRNGWTPSPNIPINPPPRQPQPTPSPQPKPSPELNKFNSLMEQVLEHLKQERDKKPSPESQPDPETPPRPAPDIPASPPPKAPLPVEQRREAREERSLGETILPVLPQYGIWGVLGVLLFAVLRQRRPKSTPPVIPARTLAEQLAKVADEDEKRQQKTQAVQTAIAEQFGET